MKPTLAYLYEMEFYGVKLKTGLAIGDGSSPALFVRFWMANEFRKRLKDHGIDGKVVKVSVEYKVHKRRSKVGRILAAMR